MKLNILIGTIILVVILFFIKFLSPEKNNYIDIIDSDNKQIDSIIKIKDSLERNIQDIKYQLDSIKSVKQKVIIKNNILYEDFNNKFVVDDDSICRYISKKINN